MQLLFVGTGAADWPGDGVVAVEAARRGHARSHASLLVDGRVLFDCGPTVPAALRLWRVAPSRITDLFITHTHGDHLEQAALRELAAARSGCTPLRVWMETGAAATALAPPGTELRSVAVGVPVEADGMAVTPLPANHPGPATERPVHYLIEAAGVRCLYATDGAWVHPQTWLALRGRRLDALVWDATIGESTGDWRIFEHNSVDMIRLMLQTLRRENVVDGCTRVLLTHLARTLCAPHAELAARLLPEGLVPAHDGMVVELQPAQS